MYVLSFLTIAAILGIPSVITLKIPHATTSSIPPPQPTDKARWLAKRGQWVEVCPTPGVTSGCKVIGVQEVTAAPQGHYVPECDENDSCNWIGYAEPTGYTITDTTGYEMTTSNGDGFIIPIGLPIPPPDAPPIVPPPEPTGLPDPPEDPNVSSDFSLSPTSSSSQSSTLPTSSPSQTSISPASSASTSSVFQPSVSNTWSPHACSLQITTSSSSSSVPSSSRPSSSVPSSTSAVSTSSNLPSTSSPPTTPAPTPAPTGTVSCAGWQYTLNPGPDDDLSSRFCESAGAFPGTTLPLTVDAQSTWAAANDNPISVTNINRSEWYCLLGGRVARARRGISRPAPVLARVT